LLEVGGLINAFSPPRYAGILCLIIKFANMAYNSELKRSSLPKNKKSQYCCHCFFSHVNSKPINKQDFYSGISKGKLTEKELWEKL
jgi:hypothetical protein